MEKDAQSLREDLYRVIQHYAELAELAQRGEVDPIGQIGKIVKKTSPYLLMVIRDLIPHLERKEITYTEALFHLMKAAHQFPDLKILIDSRKEIQKIEEGKRVFFAGIKWLDSPTHQRPKVSEIETIRRKLGGLNNKYRERYASDEEDTTVLIPSFFVRQDSESPDGSVIRMADLVKRAVLELHHLMVDHEPARYLYFFNRPSRAEIEDEIMQLAWFLFRCGYGVERIASGYFKDLLSDFLNGKLLDELISTAKTIDTVQGLSSHLWMICLIHFASFFEIPNDYIELDDPREVARHIRFIRSKNRRGANLLGKMLDLQKAYAGKPYARQALNLLLYRYDTAFGAYHGEHRVFDARGDLAVELYKPRLDRTTLDKQVVEDLNESGRCFSSKTRDEMADLIRLIMDSLADPSKVKGNKCKVLGDISSGAMGKVSVGIFQNRIVAIKRVKAQATASLGDPVTLLKYEAAMHARVQTPEQHDCVVEYYGLIDQDNEMLLLNGYHPNDNLTQLVEKNWLEKHKPPFSTESKLSLATLEIVINQLLDCLRAFRAKGVIHRDLKTDNVLYMVDASEKLNRIKVIDFGVAVAVGGGAVDDIFRGKVVGTFSYMAPEQAKGRSGFESDLYSVGAIFAVLLTGKLPMVFPKTKTRQELVKQIVRIESETRPRLVQLNPLLKKNTVLEHIAETIQKMLDLDPMRRPSIEEIQEAFNGVFQYVGNQKHTISIFYDRG